MTVFKVLDQIKDFSDNLGLHIADGSGPFADVFAIALSPAGITSAQLANLPAHEAFGLVLQTVFQSSLTESEKRFCLEAISSDLSEVLA